jgi:hypothetical protein
VPAPVYSERFVYTELAGAYVWECPENHRAIVSNIVICNTRNEAEYYVVVSVHGIQLVLRYPAPSTTESFQLRQVLYERETVQLITSANGLNAMVSGYLFADPEGRTAPPGRSWRAEVPDTKPTGA